MQNAEQEFKFELNCKAEEITAALSKVIKIIRQEINESEELEFKFELAAREILANAIEHGCFLAQNKRGNPEKLKIKTRLKISSETVIYSVKDPGPGFDWENYDLKTMPKFDEKGRGLKMINKVTDQMEFNQDGNKITISFQR